jgi:hypothetical protein
LESKDKTVPEFLGGVDNTHEVDTMSVADNLFHTVMRVARTENRESWILTRHLILPDTMPIAFPAEVLGREFYSTCKEDGHLFIASVAHDLGPKDVQFALNPVFCMTALKIALTKAGTVSMEEALDSVSYFTCAFQHMPI